MLAWDTQITQYGTSRYTDSLMKSLSCLTLSNAILTSRAGSWYKYCTQGWLD